MRSLSQKVKETFPFIKIDFVGSDWFEFFINDRIILLDNIKAIETFISDYNVRCNITRVREWQEVNYDNLVFNNPTSTFRFCIRKSSKGFSFNTNSIANESDTTDPLYDIDLFSLQDKQGDIIVGTDRLIEAYKKTLYGFDISLDSLAEVTSFMNDNILNRKMSFIKQGDRDYIVRVYMKDKEYLFEPSSKIEKQKRSKKDEIVDYSKLTKKELNRQPMQIYYLLEFKLNSTVLTYAICPDNYDKEKVLIKLNLIAFKDTIEINIVNSLPCNEDNIILIKTNKGKIKRLIKQRDYWKTKAEKLDNIFKAYPKLLDAYNMKAEIINLKNSILEKDALIRELRRCVP